MDASGSVRAFSVLPSGNPQQDSKNSTHSLAAEAQVFAVCTCAGVSRVGIAGDLVLFQPTVASLAIPLAEFADAAKAIALIRAKLAPSILDCETSAQGIWLSTPSEKSIGAIIHTSSFYHSVMEYRRPIFTILETHL